MNRFRSAARHVLSSEIVEDIKIWEGFEGKAYEDAAEPPIWTIGYGHTANVKQGHVCTKSQAENWLIEDLVYAENIVKKHVIVDITQGMYDALVSFVYNCGAGKKGLKDGLVTLKNGNQSTLLKSVNAKSWHKAADEFPKWINAGGAKPRGLVLRRAKERAYFLDEITGLDAIRHPEIADQARNDAPKDYALIANAVVHEVVNRGAFWGSVLRGAVSLITGLVKGGKK